jgi:hypothetical protein
MKYQLEVLAALARERERQTEKWGEQNHGDLYWFGILLEEVGELAKALIENPEFIGSRAVRDMDVLLTPEATHELVQVGAVVVAWLEAIERRL